MRTTISIDDDILAAAKELALTHGKTAGEVISSLARKALRPDPSLPPMRNGIALLPVSANATPVTSELIRKLDEELR